MFYISQRTFRMSVIRNSINSQWCNSSYRIQSHYRNDNISHLLLYWYNELVRVFNRSIARFIMCLSSIGTLISSKDCKNNENMRLHALKTNNINSQHIISNVRAVYSMTPQSQEKTEVKFSTTQTSFLLWPYSHVSKYP
jgi:hypothetical protein